MVNLRWVSVSVLGVFAAVVPACGDAESEGAGGNGGRAAGASGSAGRSGGSGAGGRQAGAAGMSQAGGRAGEGSGESGAGGEPAAAGADPGIGGGGTNGSAGEGGSAGIGTDGPGGDGGDGGDGGQPGSGRDARCNEAEQDELAGSGSSDDPYLVCLAEQLSLIGTNPYAMDRAFALGDDLDLASLDEELASIGAGSAFTGVFDGRGHAIRGASGALFELVESGAEILELRLLSGEVDAEGLPTSWGLLTRTNLGTVRGVSVVATLRAGSHVGLLIGTNQGVVERCSARGVITSTGAHVGGLVGVNYGTVRRSSADVDVNAGVRVGGLVGRQTAPGVIEESFSLGAVSGSSATGGLVGTLFGGRVVNSFSRAPSVSASEAGGLVGNFDGAQIELTNSYAAVATLSGEGAEGLVGAVSSGDDAAVTSSYFLDSGTGSLGVALSAAAMQDTASFVGWDFDAVWELDAEQAEFPSLRRAARSP